MFERSLTISVLMILTALIPFIVQSRWLVALSSLAWILIWGFVYLVHNNVAFLPAVGWLYLFLIVIFPLVRWRNLNWMWFQAICACCATAAYGIAMIEFLPAYREHQELLVKYPAQDLRARLAYEQHSSPAEGEHRIHPASASTFPNYDPSVLNKLDDGYRVYLDLGSMHVERRRIDRRMAFQALSQAHEGFVADFIAQPGVGRSRFPGLKLLRKSSFIDEWEGVRIDVPPDLIKQPDALPPPISSDKELSAGAVAVHKQSGPTRDAAIPDVSAEHFHSLHGLHLHNITNFAAKYTWGGVNDQMQARGFDAHAFQFTPQTKGEWEGQPADWRITRLELVSLLKHRPPAVYVSAHLPSMDELRDAPVRRVTPFESNAIAKLIAGQDLVIEYSGNSNEFHMLGSIRAISDCRECHQVPYGGLLGAFTYKLKTL